MTRFLIACLLLTACAPFPDLEDTVTERARTADYPRILPMDDILAEAENTQITPDTTADLENRAERLRKRAERLQEQQGQGAQ